MLREIEQRGRVGHGGEQRLLRRMHVPYRRVRPEPAQLARPGEPERQIAQLVHEPHADVFRVSPGPAGVRPDATIVNEGLARWSYEGRTGYGISEYLHQLDANARPVVPIE